MSQLSAELIYVKPLMRQVQENLWSDWGVGRQYSDIHSQNTNGVVDKLALTILIKKIDDFKLLASGLQ